MLSSLSPSLSTPSKHIKAASSHRLLYRGSLSLPDSFLLLDGLSFVSHISHPSASKQSPSTTALFDNPLALALESMRGRPSLHFLGTDDLNDVCLDESSVSVYIHPDSILSRIYFENILCLSSVASDGRTKQGIRVGLSDAKDLEANDFLIYGHVPSSSIRFSSASTSKSPPLNLCASRILPHPPPIHQNHKPASRPPRPRPDDPTPRKPPPGFGSPDVNKRKRELSLSSTSQPLKRVRTSLGIFSASEQRSSSKGRVNASGRLGKDGDDVKAEDEKVKIARDVMLNMPRSGTPFEASVTATKKGKKKEGRGKEESVDKDGVFKVPAVPGSLRKAYSQSDVGLYESDGGHGEVRDDEESEDVFGGGGGLVMPSSSKGKNKAPTALVPESQSKGSSELEKANKTVIKQAAVSTLSKHGLHKGQFPEWNDLFQNVYRGVCFALRHTIRTQAVQVRMAEKLLEAHTRMYVNGNGENHVVGSATGKPS